MTDAAPTLLSLPDACKAFRLPYQRLWRATLSGAVPAQRVGKRLRVSPGDVRSWLLLRDGPRALDHLDGY